MRSDILSHVSLVALPFCEFRRKLGRTARRGCAQGRAGPGCLPVVWSIGSRSNFMPPAALSQCSISESRKPRRKYLSYKMSNCFSNSFQFPTTSRRVSEKTISFCTNPIHIQLFIFKKFSSGMHHQRNVQGYSEAVRLQSFKNLVL